MGWRIEKGRMMSSETQMNEIESIACWINRVAHELSSANARAVASHDLTAMEANLLIRMDLGMESPSEIATCLGVDASNLSRLIRGLEAAGLATRKVDDKNRSRAILRLTRKGRDKAAAVHPDKRRMEESIVPRLTDAEIRNLLRILRKLTETC